MQPLDLVYTLQLMDSFFPVGAFAYSDGLETAVSKGKVRDAEDLESWIRHFLNAVFIPCDGLALAECMTAIRAGDAAAVHRLDEELTAIRPSLSVRQGSRGVGKRLLASYASLSGDSWLTEMGKDLPMANAVTAYALVFFLRGIEERDALLAFGYNRFAGMVSAGLRLIPMGHQRGQELLSRLIEQLPLAVEKILKMKGQPLTSFSPMVDIHQMNHRYVYSRLFRS